MNNDSFSLNANFDFDAKKHFMIYDTHFMNKRQLIGLVRERKTRPIRAYLQRYQSHLMAGFLYIIKLSCIKLCTM